MTRHYRLSRATSQTSIVVESCDDDTDWAVEATFAGNDQDDKAQAYLESVAGIPLELFDEPAN